MTGEGEPRSGGRRERDRAAGRREWVRLAFAVAACGALFLALFTSGQVIVKKWLPLLLPLAPAVAFPAILARPGVAGHRVRLRWLAPLLAAAVFVLLLLFSSTVRHPWWYFLNWEPGGEAPLRTGLVRFALWTSALTPLFLRPRKRLWVAAAALLVAAEVWCAHGFFEETAGRAVYRTDHPSLMFRLWEFGQTFPRLVNYNPYWNAGTMHSAGVTSGVGGPGLLLWPLWAFFPTHEVYNVAVGLLFLVAVPWMAFAAVRAAGGDRLAAAIAGVLSMGVSQHFLLWTVHYGTIGSAFCMTFAIPFTAVAFRLVWRRRAGWGTAVALALSAFFLLLWPPGAIVAGATALAALLCARRWTRRTVLVAAGGGVAALALYTPWLCALLGGARMYVGFALDAPDPDGVPLAASLAAGARRLAAHLQEGHPVILFFGVAGAFAILRGGLRRWFAPILAVLALVTGWAEGWMPRSQFSRMAVPLMLVAVVPAAIGLSRLLRARDARLAVVRAGAFVLLALGALTVERVYAGRGRAGYVTLSPDVERFAGWIRSNVPAGARLMFAGRCVHAFGAGNVAYLPVLAGREMMAGDYYGFPAGMIEYNYPPALFRRSIDNMKTFFEAYNVTHVVTYRAEWKAFFRGEPSVFAEIETYPGLHDATLFAVRRTPRPLLGAAGRARAGFNRIDVELDAPADEVILPYNWVEGLSADAPVAIGPHAFFEQITLIRARPNGAARFTIRCR